MMTICLYIALAYLLATSLVFGMNLCDFRPLPPAIPDDFSDSRPLVSICIPARNEQPNIKRCATSALSQTYASVEILVLDDQSTDQTPHILAGLAEEHPDRLRIMNGKDKPDHWLGKSWACHQLSQNATGDILFFIDADTWLASQAVAKSMYAMQKFSVDFITLWPMQKLGTFWEKVVIPLVYYGLLSLLPVRYVHRNPRWLPEELRQSMGARFAAACGQCMIFRRDAYQTIGGHQAVKQDIVEDVALARRIKQEGFSMRMFHGQDAIWCRMYSSGREMWQGFRKNFLALFDGSVSAFCLMALLNFIAYIVPVFAFLQGMFVGDRREIMLSGVIILLYSVHRIILAGWFQWSKIKALLHPLGVLWFHALGLQVLKDFFWGQRADWKGRSTE